MSELDDKLGIWPSISDIACISCEAELVGIRVAIVVDIAMSVDVLSVAVSVLVWIGG